MVRGEGDAHFLSGGHLVGLQRSCLSIEAINIPGGWLPLPTIKISKNHFQRPRTTKHRFKNDMTLEFPALL